MRKRVSALIVCEGYIPRPFRVGVLILVCFLSIHLYGETAEEKVLVPPSALFHNAGRNFLGALSYNYGANFVGAGLGTWALIETGIDWKWRNITYENRWLANAGLPLLAAGYIVPVAAPLAMYLAGRLGFDEKLQLTALALSQASLFMIAVQVPAKIITGRTPPEVISGVFFEPQTRNDSTVDFSGEFNWFKLHFNDGWPSGHAGLAVIAASVISEIYDDKPFLKFGLYTYAALVGVSVGVNVHWASDVFAGVLMGYAIGKTVGKSYKRLLEKDADESPVSLYFNPNGIGITIRK